MAATNGHVPAPVATSADSSAPVSLEPLRGLLIDLGRSLLQYVAECWPWSSALTESAGPSGLNADAAQRKINELATRQRQGVARLAELLNRRSTGAIDFGTYPTDYTDLHYCALDFLLRQLVANESALAQSAASARGAVSSDAVASALLERIEAEQRKIGEELRAIRVPKAVLTA